MSREIGFRERSCAVGATTPDPFRIIGFLFSLFCCHKVNSVTLLQQNGLSGVDLGDATDDFKNLANQMWFSRELEVEAESDVMPRPGTREQSDSTSLVPAAVPLPRNPAVTDKTAQIISVPADAVKREILNYRNGDRVVRSDSLSNVLHDLGKLFKMRYAGRSRYAEY